ncbi:MAG: T9SS type A sorting domain-containing protein [Bacteroidia bacterium]
MCPDNLDQINRAVGWNAFCQTPDYFNSCSSYGGFSGVPLNQFDFQNPRTGNAYAGFFTLTASVNYRECIGIHLNQPLIIGQSYYASFYLSRVSGTGGQHKNIGTNKIGLRFSTVLYSFNNPIPINNFAHLYTDSIITDTINWIRISGFVVADSAYEYLCIGNFFQDSFTSFIKFDSLATSAYYFVDDVSIIDSVSTGLVENNKFSTIEIYPNLFHDELTIEGSDVKSVFIFDGSGRKCIESVSKISLKKINTSNLRKGMYFIKVNNSDNFLLKK